MKTRHLINCVRCLGLLSISLLPLLLFPASARAQINSILGTAGNFAALGASTITNSGLTTVSGDMGVSPGTTVTGFPPGTISGTIHSNDAAAIQAQQDASAAYTTFAGKSCTSDLTGQDLGGKTLTPGIYCFASSAQLTGTLTLDGQGDSTSIFIFQIGSTLITASNANVVLTNEASAYDSFWQVGSAATLGADTSFAGNVLANTSITASAGVATNGGLYALDGAVSLDTDALAIALAPFTVTVDSASFTPITLNGSDQTMTGQLKVTVVDQTGTETGWHLMVTSTQFETEGGKTLPTTATSITAADSTCISQSSCTTATNSLSYPFTLPAGATAPTAIRYFSAAANTGDGSLTVTSTLSLKVPAISYRGAYSAIVYVSLLPGP